MTKDFAGPESTNDAAVRCWTNGGSVGACHCRHAVVQERLATSTGCREVPAALETTPASATRSRTLCASRLPPRSSSTSVASADAAATGSCRLEEVVCAQGGVDDRQDIARV